MLSGDDFNYSKKLKTNHTAIIVKKSLLLGAVLLSIACFVYITISAYYFTYKNQQKTVEVVKSPTEPIKITQEVEDLSVKDTDKTVYDNIIANKNLSRENLDNINVIKQADLPLDNKTLEKEQNPSQIENQKKAETTKESLKKDIPSIKTSLKVTSQNLNQNQQIIDEKQQPTTKTTIKKENNTGAEKIKVEAKNNQLNTSSKLGNKSNIVNSHNPFRVQLASLKNKKAAVEYWKKANKDFPQLFSGVDYSISGVNLGSKGIFYRLQVGNFKNSKEAQEFCHRFISKSKKSKADCIITQSTF